jgi:hypothetical protein
MANWWWRADYAESCNCAHGCPCNVTQLPTDGTCQAVVAWKVREGAFGSTRLDGLALGLIVRWPNAIHRGNGRAVVFVDERADTAQRDALSRIGTGAAGDGGPFAIFAGTYAEPATVVVGPLRFERDGRRASLRFGELASAEIGPVRGDMDGSEADVHLVMPSGFVFRDALIANTNQCETKATGLSFRHRNSSAFLSEVAYNV